MVCLKGKYNGVRVGEAGNPGPYAVGGASSSEGIGGPEVQNGATENGCMSGGRMVTIGEGDEWLASQVVSEDDGWWDRGGMEVQESWTLLGAIDGGGPWEDTTPEERRTIRKKHGGW